MRHNACTWISAIGRGLRVEVARLADARNHPPACGRNQMTVAHLAIERARRLLRRGDATVDELEHALRAVLLSSIPDELRERCHDFIAAVAPTMSPAVARRMLNLLRDVYPPANGEADLAPASLSCAPG